MSYVFRLFLSYTTINALNVGGDGPKLIDLLQMREKNQLQDRIELLGSVRHSDVRNVRHSRLSDILTISNRLCRCSSKGLFS